MEICKKMFFFIKKYIRDYIQLYSQPCLSEVFSENFVFFYNIFFTKSKTFKNLSACLQHIYVKCLLI